MKDVAIIGGTGYGAIELIRLLHSHQHMQIKKIISHSRSGEQLASIYPHLKGIVHEDLKELEIDKLKDDIDIVFLATPAGVAKDIIPQLEDADIQCVDLSGDLRLDTEEMYETWYKKKAAPQKTLDKKVYGLPELYKEEIKQAKIISNPGCFPTSTLLGLIPATHHGIVSLNSIVIDGKTGVSGAGRKSTAMTHFSETNDNVKPYKIGEHQHIPEIEQYLSYVAKEPIAVTFTTNLIPMTRGLMCTIYTKLSKKVTTEEVIDLYQNFYEGHPYVRIKEKGAFPTTKEVTGSNYCDIGLHVDSRTNQLIIISAIDNLVKGASGQAIQNVNIMNGWEETHGLDIVPMYP